MSPTPLEPGIKLLGAVERLLSDPAELVGNVEALRWRAAAAGVPPEEHRHWVAHQLIGRAVRKTAAAGGLSGLPALIPGVGTVVALLGGTAADAALTLKYEVELALSLAHLHGFDIRLEEERRIAFLLASVHAWEVSANRNFFLDLAEATGTALWDRAPRQATKLMLTAATQLALRAGSRGFAKAVPLAGMIFGSSLNAALTQRVGARCLEELEKRTKALPVPRDEDDIVDAKVIEVEFGRDAARRGDSATTPDGADDE